MAAEPPRKRLRYAISDGLDITTAPVLIYVGKSKQKIYVYENLLCANSEFFQKALKKEWAEGQERAVKLPDVHANIFKIWVQWLYTGKIFLTKEDDLRVTPAGQTVSDEWPRWKECYVLGDFLQDLDFKDACIDVGIEAMSSARKLPKVLPDVLYAYSPANSAHRQLAIDTFVECLRRSEFAWYTNRLPEAFLRDALVSLAPRLVKGLEQQNIASYLESVDVCKYHVHGPDKPCYRTKRAFLL